MRTPARTPRPRLAHPPRGVIPATAFVTGLVAGWLGTRRLGIDPERIRLIAQEQEQDALRRVTTLSAGGASSTEIFDAVVGEMGRVIAADNVIMFRLRADGTCAITASWSAHGEATRIVDTGVESPIHPGSVGAEILRTGRPAHKSYSPALLEEIFRYAPVAREIGIRSAAGAPILVEGRMWGMLITYFATCGPHPVEDRMLGFLELVAIAIANVESRAELTASRARVVAAADASRRRVERDLHDGAQQRLVRLALSTRLVADDVRPGRDELRERLSGMVAGLTDILDDLREISHGLHPAILARGGLKPALATLARRSPVPVELDLDLVGRLADGVEVAIYNVVSEALINTATHANASLVRIGSRVHEDPAGSALTLTVADDGTGGADPGGGHGLIGLRDRVEALGGRLDVSSPAGLGTTLTVRIPIGSPPPEDA